ncbi:MAG: Enoyl-CoA hydratase [Myxococcaceae bacterium]|nr:Enoyl-CoA hydratase [Myxococcaceae bacterium]
MPASLTVTDCGDGIRCLTLSNPARKNALDEVALEQLRAALSTAEPVRCWLVRGEGQGAFSAGYDLSALTQVGEGRLPDDALGDVFDLLQQHPAPSVALVTGPAFGAGCELACACDFRVGDPKAVFCLPPAKIGVVYAARGIRRVAALTGLGRAKWMLLTGARVEAEEARLFGLLDVLTPDAEGRALGVCRDLAQGAPLAIAGMKQTFSALMRGGPTAQEAQALEQLRRAAFNSADAREGREAFLARRPPKFSGR